MNAEFFEALMEETFTAIEQDMSLQLVGVSRLAGSETNPDRQPFSLTFKAWCDELPTQGIYKLEHPSVGSLDIFLVPVGMSEEEYLFEAVFN
jgi:hypothetical protein